MVIDFSKIDFTKRPKFILRNLDDSAIGYLSNVLKPKGTFCYNEISEISFEYPSQINGEKLDEYDLLTGMRVIDVQGYGQFILRNPEETDNGVVKIKSCKAYSLEHELTNKNITLEEGTYCFWNPFAVESSILGIIMSEVPSWTIGTVSDDLIGKYRTFSVSTKNIYDWIKSDLQEAYGCIFDFDTYNRKINVRSINEIVNTKPVYLSTKNLIKEIEIEENTDELVTALDVYGADGVTIRSVNPMGLNRIFNLDAYMNNKYFSDEIIEKWSRWKSTFESYQQPYYQLIIAQNMQISRYTTEESVLAEMNGELLALETKQSTIHQAIAVDQALQSELNSINSQISSKKTQIAAQENLLKSIQSQIDSYTSQLKSINKRTAFDSFFTSDELKILDRYFRCGSLTDSTFVATSTDAYAVDTKTISGISAIFNLTNLTSMTQAPYGNDMTFYIIRGGSIGASTSNAVLNAQIVNGTLQVNSDRSFVFSLYLNKGTFNGAEFPSGNLAMTGTLSTSVSSSASSLQFKTSSATLYLTQDVTEYQKMSIEWELFEYGFETLEKLSSPDYFFSTSVVNFLALEDYIDFAKELSLGERVYLQMEKGVVTPIVTSIEVDFDDLTDFTIDFGNAYKLNDASFKFEDLLDQSISSASSLDFNKYNYSNFVTSGAKTQVKDFMTSAIDTMKNMIMSGTNNELTIDQTGLRCRKYDEASGGYSPKQLWLAHNALMFTNDNWNSATIGIGEFVDKNLGSIFGIVAPAIVGTILAGTSLVIESEKQDGGVAVFKVDAEGASLHNASFNLYGSTGGRIDLGAVFGIVGGGDKNTMFYYNSKGQPTGVRTENNRSVTRIDNLASGDTPNANFWIDMYGDVYLKGTIDAVGGIFRGSLEVGGPTAFRVDSQGNLSIGGTATNPNFYVDANGNVRAKSADIKGRIDASSLYVGGKNILTNTTGSNNLATNNSKISPNYLDLYGITIRNKDTNEVTFQVSNSGAVTINGNITIGSGSSINWAQVNNYNIESNPAYSTAMSAQNTANSAWSKADGAQSTANSALITASSAQNTVSGWCYSGTTKINGREIETGTVTASKLQGGSVSLLDYYGGTSGYMTITSATSGAYAVDLTSYAALRLSANNGLLYLSGGPDIGVGCNNFYPIGRAANLGSPSGGMWQAVYSYTGEILTSDRNLKLNIESIPDRYIDMLDQIKPVRFKMKNGSSERYHIGFIAQDVKNAMEVNEIEAKDFAGWCKDTDNNGNEIQMLRYIEFIGLMLEKIKRLEQKIKKFELMI